MRRFPGLLGCGAEVIDAGICPAPMLHHLVRRGKLDGAILIGAGHHQAGWNAVAPLSSRGSYFSNLQTQELLGIYHSGIYRTVPWNAVGKIRPCPQGLVGSYLDLLSSLVDAEKIASRRFKVIADFCNGSGSTIAEAFAKRFGVEMVPINNILSGVLPHDPEPRPRTAMQVQSLIKVLNADIGFVFNSDMSRASVVTDSGENALRRIQFPDCRRPCIAACGKRRGGRQQLLYHADTGRHRPYARGSAPQRQGRAGAHDRQNV